MHYTNVHVQFVFILLHTCSCPICIHFVIHMFMSNFIHFVIHMFMSNLYSFCYTHVHVQFVFILLCIYIQIYFRIYKALNILLWMIPCKKRLERWCQHAFHWSFTSSPACQLCCMTLLLHDFDKHSSLFIQL